MAKIPFVPKFSSTDIANELPRIPVNPPFVWVFSPESWHVAHGELVPALLHYPLVEGVNQVEKGRDGSYRKAKLDANLTENAERSIPYEWGPDGSYMQAVETRPKASVTATTYISVFSDAYAGDSRIYANAEAYTEWLAGLVKSGKLPPCPVHRIQKMLHNAKRDLLEAEIAVEHKPSEASTSDLARLKAEVEVLQAALDARTSQPRKKASKKPAKVTDDGDEE